MKNLLNGYVTCAILATILCIIPAMICCAAQTLPPIVDSMSTLPGAVFAGTVVSLGCLWLILSAGTLAVWVRVKR